MMGKRWRNCIVVRMVTLTVLLALSNGCTMAQWSRILRSKALSFVDDGDGRALLPTILDIITGDEGLHAHEKPFGRVVMTAPQKLLDDGQQSTDEDIASAVLDYFRQYAGGHAIEFVEDYTRRVGETVSMCFSQAVNGTRIYGTAACAEVHQSELRSAWHLFVVPPSICTEPEISAARAVEVALNHANMASPLPREVTPELNVIFVDRVPTLIWRVPVPRTASVASGNRTYFIDAKSGQLTAVTTAGYRQTDGAKERQEQGSETDDMPMPSAPREVE